MPDIKGNIKEELLKLIEDEFNKLEMRRLYIMSKDETYQLLCEENFLNKLKKFAESI